MYQHEISIITEKDTEAFPLIAVTNLDQVKTLHLAKRDKVLMGCSSFAMGYLDDIIIFSKTEEHLQHLEEMFTRLRNFGLKMKRENYSFFKKHIQYWARNEDSNWN